MEYVIILRDQVSNSEYFGNGMATDGNALLDLIEAKHEKFKKKLAELEVGYVPVIITHQIIKI